MSESAEFGELLKMGKEELLARAQEHWKNWIKNAVELENLYKEHGLPLPKIDQPARQGNPRQDAR